MPATMSAQILEQLPDMGRGPRIGSLIVRDPRDLSEGPTGQQIFNGDDVWMHAMVGMIME
jgi:hypothetical protein